MGEPSNAHKKGDVKKKEEGERKGKITQANWGDGSLAENTHPTAE